MRLFRQLDGGVDQRTAALVGIGKALRHSRDPAAQLRERIARVLCLEPVPAGLGVPRGFAQVVRHQRVLRGEVAIERHLVGSGRLGDGVDPNRADPIPIEQLARDREDPRPRGNSLGLVGTYVS